MDGLFNIVFSGRLLPNKTNEEVQKNMASLFKTSEERIAQLFSSDTVVIKKNLDYSAAIKYQSAIKQAGALVVLQKVEADESNDMTHKSDDNTPTQNYQAQDQQEQSHQEASTSAPLNNEAMSYAETSEAESTQEDASQPEESDDATLGLAAAGELLKPIKEFIPKDVDTSALSLGNVGERLGPEKKQDDPPPPDITHLSLEKE